MIAKLLCLGAAMGLSLVPAWGQQTHEGHESHHGHEDHTKHFERATDLQYMEEMRAFRSRSVDGPESELGSWETVIPKAEGAAIERILGMQTVHNLLLPSGKVLMVSGSSWRNFKNIQTFPDYTDPITAMGLFNMYDDPFRNSRFVNAQVPNFRKENYYDLVNNAAIYDPVENTFYRIPHPVPVDEPRDSNGVAQRFVPSDMFCTGHLQLPNGNPLFVGGTQYYFPYRTGHNSTFIFDWKKELGIDWRQVDWRVMPTSEYAPSYPWEFSGFLKRGRWYPSLVPLLDGRIVVFSGFVGFDEGFPRMYRFQINPYIEFFNPAAYRRDAPQEAWKVVDAKTLPNGPFTTEINPGFVPPPCYDVEFQAYWESRSCDNDFPLPCECGDECINDNKFDAFKLYPNNYLLSKNRIFLSREGDWVSLRTGDTKFMRRTKHTYFMEFNEDKKNPKVSFSLGPDRPDTITSYGTSYVDPNTGSVTILGGQPTSPGTLLPLDSKNPTQFAGGLGSRKKEDYNFSGDDVTNGVWRLEKDFLGTHFEDNRTMLTAILLPTRQVLVINGGNYDFYGPVFFPILMTPVFANGKFVRYDRRRLAPAVEPRLYHNGAMLLPDGRVIVSGGNSARASVSQEFPKPPPNRGPGQPKPDLDLVDVNMYFFRDGQMARALPGMQVTPTENWTAEIFSPPYRYIDPGRELTLSGFRDVNNPGNSDFYRKLHGKDFYLLRGNRTYSMVVDGLPPAPGDASEKVVLIKLPSFTHNWDNGQMFIDLKILPPEKEESRPPNSVVFTTPDMQDALIPPGFFMLFYVDSKGKPSASQMVRFDDLAANPLE
ncbi:MAG: galactose oxidase-like domain-containing protein [Bacteroidota bacterium]